MQSPDQPPFQGHTPSCIAITQHVIKCAICPAELPLVKASRKGKSSHNTHGYRHKRLRCCGLRQGPGDTSRIDESDKEQNVLQPVSFSPTGTSYYNPTPHHGPGTVSTAVRSTCRCETAATEAFASPSKAFDPSAIPSLDLHTIPLPPRPDSLSLFSSSSPLFRSRNCQDNLISSATDSA